jgi:Holliday junction resolvase RusA-like endonuclease
MIFPTSDTKFKITILGEPISKQSFRFTLDGRKYQPKDIIEAKKNIKIQTLAQLPENYKVVSKHDKIGFCVTYTYYFMPPNRIPSKHKKLMMSGVNYYRAKKPDTDNLQKNYNDALNGIIWEDDSLIVKVGGVEKFYSYNPRVELLIELIKLPFM